MIDLNNNLLHRFTFFDKRIQFSNTMFLSYFLSFFPKKPEDFVLESFLLSASPGSLFEKKSTKHESLLRPGSLPIALSIYEY